MVACVFGLRTIWGLCSPCPCPVGGGSGAEGQLLLDGVGLELDGAALTLGDGA